MPRLQIAVEYVDGRKEVVTVGRPADLIAFADVFDKVAPDGAYVVREASWLVHRALRIDRPLAEWVGELENLEVVRSDAANEAKVDEATGVPEPDPTPAESSSSPTLGEVGEWPRIRTGRRIVETHTASSSHA